MLSIGSAIPHDNATLHAGLLHGLSPLGIGAEAIALEGTFPQLSTLRLDLTGARFHRGLTVSRPADDAPRQQLGFAREVLIHGAPVHLEAIPASLRIQAGDAILSTVEASGADGGTLLTLDRAGQGTIELSVARTALEEVLRKAGQTAAESKGAEVQTVNLEVRNESARVVAIRVHVTAKAMFFTTTITVSGRLEINDRLEARLSDLHCEGDGMIGKMVAGALRPQFEKIQSRAISLGRAVAGLQLHDIQLTGGEDLRIHASFGGETP